MPRPVFSDQPFKLKSSEESSGGVRGTGGAGDREHSLAGRKVTTPAITN
jgi:hypothetical protein